MALTKHYEKISSIDVSVFWQSFAAHLAPLLAERRIRPMPDDPGEFLDAMQARKGESSDFDMCTVEAAHKTLVEHGVVQRPTDSDFATVVEFAQDWLGRDLTRSEEGWIEEYVCSGDPDQLH